MTEIIKYVIVRFDDMQKLYQAITNPLPNEETQLIIDRMESDQGADIQDIVNKLKTTPFCIACQFESQTHTCESIVTKQLGRRLGRLLDRANYGRPQDTQVALTDRKIKQREQFLKDGKKEHEKAIERETIAIIEKILAKRLQSYDYLFDNKVFTNDKLLVMLNDLTQQIMAKYPTFEGGHVMFNVTDTNSFSISEIKKKV